MDKPEAYTVTVYDTPLAAPAPPQPQRRPMTLLTMPTLYEAIELFDYEVSQLDTGCVQLWIDDDCFDYHSI